MSKKPIIVMAPMADVTDFAFRQMFVKYGKPDMMWTEFVSADGLVKAPEEGQKKIREAFKFSKKEKPIVAQIFSATPDHVYEAAKIIVKLGFDGVDINMGCPDKNVLRQCAGAKLITNPSLAKKIILAAKEGVHAATKKGKKEIPVSVKTRIGFNKDELETWLPELLSAEPALITVHARTKKEMSLVPARWERVKRAVEIRDEYESKKNGAKKHHTLIFGNGDVVSMKDALQKARDTGCDGIMVGRGIFGNPWFFNKKYFDKEPTIKEKLKALVEHTKLFDKHIEFKGLDVMKKHYKAYVHGFDGAKELRMELMQTKNSKEVEKVVKEFIVDRL